MRRASIFKLRGKCNSIRSFTVKRALCCSESLRPDESRTIPTVCDCTANLLMAVLCLRRRWVAWRQAPANHQSQLKTTDDNRESWRGSWWKRATSGGKGRRQIEKKNRKKKGGMINRGLINVLFIYVRGREECVDRQQLLRRLEPRAEDFHRLATACGKSINLEGAVKKNNNP